MDVNNNQLPPLREDLTIHPGPKTIDGYPTWSVYDPIAHQYYRLGWLEFQLLSNWNTNTVTQLIDTVNQSSTLKINADHVNNFITFLTNNDLIEHSPAIAAKILHEKQQQLRKQKLKNISRSYLFFKIGLFKPDNFLAKTLPYIRFLFHQYFYYCVAFLAIIAIYLVSRQWQQFTHTFWYFFSWQGLIYFMITIIFTKIIHELGHAYTCRYYGAKVTSIGIAILVFFPILYTDTTDAWRLTSRKQRMLIDGAGMLAELVLAVFATLLWVFLPDGALKSAMFFIATVSWLFSIAVNINPFIRFDGYYLLSDWLNIANLQQRAFALGKWRLRRLLLGITEPKPFHFSKKTAAIITSYCYAIWVYRLILFTGISLIIYHLFFKLFAILLIIITLTNFIIKPVAKELNHYWQLRKRVTMNKNIMISAIILASLILILIVPWQTKINVPALLEFHQETKIYTMHDGYIKQINVKENQTVQQGQVLLQLTSPALSKQLALIDYDIKILQARLRTELWHTEEIGYQQADEKDLRAKRQEQSGLQTEIDELTIKAPFAGIVSYLNSELRNGHPVAKDTYVVEVVDPQHFAIEAYVPESDIHNIKPDSIAKFYPDEPNLSPIQAKVTSIETNVSKILDDPYLSSTAGGTLAAEKNQQNQLVLKDAVYRVRLIPTQPTTDYHHTTRGSISLPAARESILTRVLRNIYTVIIRESG